MRDGHRLVAGGDRGTGKAIVVTLGVLIGSSAIGEDVSTIPRSSATRVFSIRALATSSTGIPGNPSDQRERKGRTRLRHGGCPDTRDPQGGLFGRPFFGKAVRGAIGRPYPVLDGEAHLAGLKGRIVFELIQNVAQKR
jgi:hypothetical protein